MDRIIKVFRCEKFLALLSITLLALVTYAPLILQLGYYRDDWYLIWSGSTQGASSIIPLFSSDRPFMGLIYSLEYSLLGDSPIAWHLYAFLLRLLGTFSLFWLLRMVWPQKRLGTTAITLLFLVYPGFLQQPSANTFQNHLMTYLLAISSIAFMVKALHAKGRLFQILFFTASLPLTLGYFLIYEYFIGLEGLRLLVLWLLSQKTHSSIKSRLTWVGKVWLPYVFVTLLFLFWRVFVFKSIRPATDLGNLTTRYSGSPFYMAARLVIETAKDFAETVFLAWAVPLYQLSYRSEYKEWMISIFLAVVGSSIFLMYYFLTRNRTQEQSGENRTGSRWGSLLILSGAITVLCTLLPMVLAGRDVYFADQFDRYTLQSSIGVAMLIAGLIFVLVHRRYQTWLIAGLLGAAVITHFQSAVYYKENWDIQKDLWQQMTWRAPQIEPGTTLIISLPDGNRFAESYEIWSPANLIYYPQPGSPVLSGEVLNNYSAQMVMQGQSVSGVTRGISDDKNFQKVLLVSMQTRSSCAHILNGSLVEYGEEEEANVRQIAEFSDISTIIPADPGRSLPAAIFGGEPEITWCYYYQKANLAKQTGDWNEAARLIDEAFKYGLQPKEQSEWLVALEAYANSGREEDAKALMSRFNLDNTLLWNPVCQRLKERQAAGDSPYPGEYNFDLIVGFLCQENQP